MKPETEIRNLKRDVKDLIKESNGYREERNIVRRERDDLRERLTKANLEIADWKRRFDALLQRTPKADSGREG